MKKVINRRKYELVEGIGCAGCDLYKLHNCLVLTGDVCLHPAPADGKKGRGWKKVKDGGAE